MSSIANSPASSDGQQAMSGCRDPITMLVATIERLDKKQESRFQEMEKTLLRLQQSNKDDLNKIDTELKHEINQKTTENKNKISFLESKIQVAVEKLGTDITNCGNQIITCERKCSDDNFRKFENSNSKINESHNINSDRIAELNHKHDSLRIGLEADIRRLRNRPITQGSNNDIARLIAKQMKLPTFSGKGWEKPVNFLRELDEYFDFLDINKETGLRLIGQSFSHDAKDWWTARRDSIRNWDEFKNRFLSRFWGEEIQRETRKDLEFGFYLPDSKLAWSEYANRKFATAMNLDPPMTEIEIVRNLVRHFDDHVVEAARSRNIRDMDTLLNFLDESQSGGRSNAPRNLHQNHLANRNFQNHNRNIDDRNKSTSWRNGNNTNAVTKQTATKDENPGSSSVDNRRKPSPHDNSPNQNRSPNWTGRVHTISEIEVDETVEEAVQITESENERSLCWTCNRHYRHS